MIKFSTTKGNLQLVIVFILALVSYIPIHSQTINVTSPKDGEKLRTHSLYEISWITDQVQKVKIEYSTNEGMTWKLISASFPAEVQKYSLVLPSVDNDTIVLKVSDTQDSLLSDLKTILISSQDQPTQINSDSFFDSTANINPNAPVATLTLTYPSPGTNGGVIWNSGDSPTITWTNSIDITNIDLSYSINGGGNWTNIATNVIAALGSYSSWAVPTTPTTELIIRIKDSGGATTSQNTKYVSIKSPQFPPASQIKILPAGNSITYDSFRAEFRFPQFKISYRYNLWDSLRTNNYNVDFIGHKLGGYSIFPDPESDGIPGIKDNQLYNFLLTGLDPLSGMQVTAGNYLNTYNPDIVLLHIGTNGVETDQSSTDVENILNLIDNFETSQSKTVWVILALIIDRVPNIPQTTAFNDNLKQMANARINAGDKILIVDLQKDAGLVYLEDVVAPHDTGDMYDDVHPNDSGKAKMANEWFKAMKLILPSSTTSSPIITSTPNTKAYVGFPYRYNVDATGVGAPNYLFATTQPTGMIIDSTTGIIDWIPTLGDLGDHLIEVKARNTPGGDSPTQQFTLNVALTPKLPDRVVSYWRMEEPSSPSYYEDLPGVNDAYPINAPNSVTGIVGNALSFNGTSNKVHVLDDSSLYFYPGEDFTIEMWVKTNQSGANQKAFLGKTEGYAGYVLSMNSSNQSEFEITDSIGNKIKALGPSINDGNWHHVVGSIDRSNNRVNIHVDGNRSSQSWSFHPSGFFSHDPLTFGFYRYNNFYNGLMDEVAIYNRRVPGFELFRHYISGLARKGYSDNYVIVSLKALLQGPYNSGTGLMDTTLKASNLIPKTLHPYTTSPWNYNGLERVVSYPDSVVDWIYVELRDPITPSTVIGKRAVFIKKNGNLMDIDPDNDTGLSPAKDSTWLNYIIFPDVSPGDYYIVIKHRNHLSIMSSSPVSLSKGSTLYDFTTGQNKAYTTGPAPMADLGGGKFGMWAGDANADGTINATDYNLFWLPQNGTPYNYFTKTADFNLDGSINATDYNVFWLVNNGKATQVP